MGLDRRRVGILACVGLFWGLTQTPVAYAGCNESLESGGERSQNPLGARSQLPHEAIDFSALRPEHFEPAFEHAVAESRTTLDAIRNDPNPPTFENTILALENFDLPLERPRNAFDVISGVNSSPEIEAIAAKWEPRLAAFDVEATLDPKLFARVEAVYAARTTLRLTEAESTLLENTYRKFVRSGANLDDMGRERVAQIEQRIAALKDEFRNLNRKATNGYQKHVVDPAILAGIPSSTVDRLVAKARETGREGWVFDLTSTYQRVMQFAENRALRQELWEAASSLGLGGELDTQSLLLEIAQLRQERAHLLGFSSHAQATLADRMVRSPEEVGVFLGRLGEVYRQAAIHELAEIWQLSGLDRLEPWDISFYARKEKERLHGISPETLRPYFPYPQVLRGAFFAAEQNYGVTFVERRDLPVWHPSVQAFEVRDRDGTYLALFYVDPYQRASKDPGAWMTNLTDAGVVDGAMRRPHVINVMNFAPPTESVPSLLTYGDVVTLFHELGHGLHGMLTQVPFRSLSGTGVLRDFVELPSQFNQRFPLHPEVLAVMARHYQTGEPIPQDLMDRLQASDNFMIGLYGMRQIALGTLDLAWYSSDISKLTPADVESFENDAIARYALLPKPGTCISTGFTHIFSDGYAAGYYGYMWADVMAADAYGLFKSGPGFDRATADRFRSTVLELGGSVNAAELYRRFAGRDPDVRALLREQGLHLGN